MSEQGESGQATATAPSTPSGGMRADADSLVTPELESAFSAVFDEGASTDSTAASDGQDGPTARERQREAEEAESLASLDGATHEDTDGVQEDGEDEGGDKDAAAEAAAQASQDRAGEGKDGSGQQKAGEDDSTLSPVLRHAAKRNGWDDKEIDELHQANPELAERTFQRLHSSYSDLSAQYARLGSQPGSQQPNGQPPQPSPNGNGKPAAQGPQARQQQPSTTDDLLSDLYGDQLEPFKQKYGEDFMDEVVKPLVDKVVAPLQEVRSHYEQQQQEALGQQVEGFFKGVPSELQEVYGADSKGLSDEQASARNELAQLADQIRAGAASQGVDMSVSEALDRASTLHAHERLQQIERKRLTEQVRRRSSKLTNRPSQRRTSGQQNATGSGGEQSIQAAQEAYAERAAELGLEI